MHTCISSHGLKRSWRSCPRRVNAGNKSTPSMHHPRRRNVTTLMVGLKNGHIRKNLTQKVVNPRDIAGERKKNYYYYYYVHLSLFTESYSNHDIFCQNVADLIVASSEMSKESVWCSVGSWRAWRNSMRQRWRPYASSWRCSESITIMLTNSCAHSMCR